MPPAQPRKIYTSVIGTPSENFEAACPPGMPSIVLRGAFTNKAKKTAEARASAED
jgi:hypothetical protein